MPRKLVALALVALALAVAAPVLAGGVDSDGRTPVNPYLRAPDGGSVRPAATASGEAYTAPAVKPDGTRTAQNADSSGNTIVVNPLCSTTAQTVVSVGVAAVLVPASALAGRKALRVCNSPENVGSPKVKCLLGGTAPVMGVANAGDVLGVGDCFPYAVDSTVALKCIADTAGTAVVTFECS